MITPSFGLTSTERVLPRLALDFTTATLDSRITFARSLNTATRVNSSGIIELINADLPRFDYDPVTLASKGLLIEEQRTNLATYSADFSDAVWTKTRASISSDAIVAPDGTQTGDKLVEDTSASSTHEIYRTTAITVGSGSTQTISFYAKAGERTRFRLIDNANATNTLAFFDLSNGSVISETVAGSASIQPAGNGWYRCTMKSVASGTQCQPQIRLVSTATTVVYTGDGVSGLYIWGAQLESGAFPTSYIPTTTTALTRNADVATMTGTNFSSWYNQTEGTFAFKAASADAVGAAGVRHAFAANDATTSNRIRAYLYANVGGQVTVGGASQASLTDGLVLANNTFYIGVLGYKTNDFGLSVNARSPVVDTAGTVPTINQLEIGSQTASQYLNGHVQKLFYWPQKLITNELQAFSKG